MCGVAHAGVLYHDVLQVFPSVTWLTHVVAEPLVELPGIMRTARGVN
jgi:hypothetical protein